MAANDRPVLASDRAPHIDKSQLSDSNKNLVLGPRRGLSPRLTDRLAVGRNVTLTWLRSYLFESRQLEQWASCEIVASR
jgi:hypothetical protein